jgi:glycosyltransferase involved in cell wall biosynthesis
MKILSISLDNQVLERDSAVQKRILEYGNLVDKYTLIVLANKVTTLDLSEKIRIISIDAKNKALGFIKLKFVVWKTLKKEKYDLITVQDVYFVGFLALWMARIYKIGLEIQVHGFEKFRGIRKLIAEYVLKRADAIRVVSQRLKKQLIKEFKVEENKIVVIPVYVGVKMVETQSIASVWKDERDKFIFLTVGRLVLVKNIEIQIKAIANLKNKIKNIELWIVGDGKLDSNLKNQSDKLGISDCIKFWGWQKNLDKFYEQADVFLLTSYSEGWPLVIMEAINSKTPIIMTDVGSAGELIINEDSGLIVPFDNELKLSYAMEEMFNNNDLRARFAENAYKHFLNLPNKEMNLSLIKELWKKAIKK